MPAIRIRKTFAASFVALLLAAAYLGLSNPKIPQYGQSDKGLHLVTFFLLTLSFYWILDTSRRRVIHLTLLTCTAGLAIGSEVLQALLPNGRSFDPFDILANCIGSTLALLASGWYHKRMLERRRKNKHYDIVPGQELGPDEDEERDVELGSVREPETGGARVEVEGQAGAGAQSKPTVTEELDNWDEHADDEWDDEPTSGGGDGQKTPASDADDGGEAKRRSD